MVDVVNPQTPGVVIVHCKILFPRPTPVTVVFGDKLLVIVALPLITLHMPTPVVGVLAANVVVGFNIQSVWLGPALAMLGAGST